MIREEEIRGRDQRGREEEKNIKRGN